MSDDKKIIFSLQGVSKIYPPQKQVLKNIYLSFFYGAKIGIIGLNGSGKSSLLKIIAGVEKDFQGDLSFSDGYTVGYLEQEPQLDESKTVMEIVKEGASEITGLLEEYEKINNDFGLPEVYEDADKMEKLMARQGVLQDKIDAVGAWELESKLERAIRAEICSALSRPRPSKRVTNTELGAVKDSTIILKNCWSAVLRTPRERLTNASSPRAWQDNCLWGIP